MKNTNRVLSLLLVLLIAFSLTACFKNEVDATGLWEDATYTADTTLGKGKTTVTVDCVVEDQKITFTIKTDKTTLGEALIENDLIEDGTYFLTFNGMTTDYNANQSWWKVCKGGEMTSVGVADLTLTNGDAYEIIYTVGF